MVNGGISLSNDVHERAYTEAIKRQVKDEKECFFSLLMNKNALAQADKMIT